MERESSAVWRGNLKQGKGTVSTGSGVLSETPYSYHSRFEQGTGTNPEELIAAAHAGCFAMALSGVLEEAGFVAEEIDAAVRVTLVPVDGKPTVTKSHLDVKAKVPGATEEDFQRAAEAAKAGCPISRLLKPGTEITMSAQLEK